MTHAYCEDRVQENGVLCHISLKILILVGGTFVPVGPSSLGIILIIIIIIILA
jgi:hypothetical protein